MPRSAWQHAQHWPCWQGREWPLSGPVVAAPPQPGSSSQPMPQDGLLHLKTNGNHWCADFFKQTQTCIGMLCHIETLHQLKFMSRENENLPYLPSQYHICYDTRSQGISSYGIDLVNMEYYGNYTKLMNEISASVKFTTLTFEYFLHHPFFIINSAVCCLSHCLVWKMFINLPLTPAWSSIPHCCMRCVTKSVCVPRKVAADSEGTRITLVRNSDLQLKKSCIQSVKYQLRGCVPDDLFLKSSQVQTNG